MAGNEFETFANVIEASREVPDSAAPQGELDVPQMFAQEPPNPNIGQVKGGAGLELSYTCHSSVFLLFRLWSKCGRCSKDIAAADEDPNLAPLLPSVGEYTCPHNQTAEYKEIVDKCLAGKLLLRKEEFFNMVDGTRLVHITWLEPDPKQYKKILEAEELKKKTRIYPPNIDEAFKEKETTEAKKTEGAKA